VNVSVQAGFKFSLLYEGHTLPTPFTVKVYFPGGVVFFVVMVIVVPSLLLHVENTGPVDDVVVCGVKSASFGRFGISIVRVSVTGPLFMH